MLIKQTTRPGSLPQYAVRPRNNAITVFDAVNGVQANNGNFPTSNTLVSAIESLGRGLSPAGSESKQAQFTVPSFTIGTGDFTIALLYEVTATITANYYFYSFGSNASSYFGVAHKTAAFSANLAMYVAGTGYSSGISCSAKGVYKIVIRRISGTLYFDVNGVTATASGASGSVGAITKCILNDLTTTPGTGLQYANYYQAAIEPRAWTDAEVAAWKESPASLYAVPSRRVWIPDAAGGTQYNQSVGGTLSLSGSTIRSVLKVVSGGLSSTGVAVKRIDKVVAGGLSFVGVLTSIKTFLALVGGTLGLSGALTKMPGKSLSGTLTIAGAAVKGVNVVLAGGLAFAGGLAVSRLFMQAVGGTLSFAGNLSKAITKQIAGTLTFAGSLLANGAAVVSAMLGIDPWRRRKSEKKKQSGSSFSTRKIRITIRRK